MHIKSVNKHSEDTIKIEIYVKRTKIPIIWPLLAPL